MTSLPFMQNFFCSIYTVLYFLLFPSDVVRELKNPNCRGAEKGLTANVLE